MNLYRAQGLGRNSSSNCVVVVFFSSFVRSLRCRRALRRKSCCCKCPSVLSSGFRVWVDRVLGFYNRFRVHEFALCQYRNTSTRTLA